MIQQPAPPAPAVSPAPGVTISTRVLDAKPMSAQELAALKARRSELSTQFNSAKDRREELSRLLRDATGVDKAGLEQRLMVVDARLAHLENDLDETGKLLASTPASLAATTQRPTFQGPIRRSDLKEIIPIVAILSVFVFFPISLSAARFLWRRGSVPKASPMDRETAHRLERMEQAMDAIAIEIERVSEGQRFVTRLLGEPRSAAPLGAGPAAAEGERVPVGERSRV